MLGTYINFGTDFASSTLTTTGTLVNDFMPFITTIGGVLLAVLVVSIIIRTLKK